MSGVINVSTDQSPVQVVQIQLPGSPGPRGAQGVPGPANVLTIGPVTTGAPGSSAAATISGVAPNQVLNLTIPQGPTGAQGAPNTLTIGTVNTVAGTTGGSATITGTAPNQVLNLVLPRGYGVIPGGTTGQVLIKNSNADYDTAWDSSLQTQITANANKLGTPTAAPTASQIVLRDANGRAQVADPAVSADIATKNYADALGVSTNTPSTIVRRDVNGNVNIAAPTSAAHAATKTYVDNADTALSNRITPLETANTNATSLSTASTNMKRDSAGRASVADPAVGTDIATKNYVDTTVGTGTAGSTTATANSLVKRDAAGRASVVDPAVSTDVATKNYTDTQDAAMRRPAVNAQTVSYTLALTDERKLVQMNSASATTLTVPANATVAFPVGSIVDVQMLGAGAVTLAPAAGVTFDSPSATLVLSRQYVIVRLQKIATDTWAIQNSGVANAQSTATASTLVIRDSAGRASVADPAVSTDIATKNYVDDRPRGIVGMGSMNVATGVNSNTMTRIAGSMNFQCALQAGRVYRANWYATFYTDSAQQPMLMQVTMTDPANTPAATDFQVASGSCIPLLAGINGNSPIQVSGIFQVTNSKTFSVNPWMRRASVTPNTGNVNATVLTATGTQWVQIEDLGSVAFVTGNTTTNFGTIPNCTA